MTDPAPVAVAVAWVTVDDVTDAIGVPPATPADADHLARCVDAANAFGYRRRAQAGYVDDPAVSPGPDVTLGTITYAVALYRERGVVDSYASFEAYAAGIVPPSTHGQVLRLLGVPRPAVDAVDPADVAAYRHRRMIRTRGW